ncbi:hypothetical protein BX592_12435 [Paraburkholderia rhizosphaerae]|uniref:Uncharacterized protein n=2 Tax=Paraburkholderia rhizosphaerae TaxID=480658 RepID=A0A4R8LC34_9BURK|nr:hypothetical protein BX592_12435 [Paraburkholderia rhizosphaerae]
MTVAAKEAVILRDILADRRGSPYPLDRLMEEPMAAIDPVIDNVWGLASVPDLSYPDARGQRPHDLNGALAYQSQVNQAALLVTR